VRLASQRPGFALEATLIVMVLISGLILAAAAAVLSQQRTLTADLRATQAMYVAEGGADAVMASLTALMADGQITDAELASISLPNLPGWTFDTLVATSDGAVTLQPITDGSFRGRLAFIQPITVTVGAVDGGGNRGDVLISTKVQSLPVFQFAVFYDDDLELHPPTNMTFDGPVHANANLYLSAPSLTFRQDVTSSDSVFRQRKHATTVENGVRINNAAGTPVLLSFDSRSTSAAAFVDASEAAFDGRLRSHAHRTAPLKLPLPGGVPLSVLLAPRSATDDAQTRAVKMAWKADLILTIDWATQGAIGPASPNHFCRNPAAVIRRDSAFSVLPTAAECRAIFRWNPTTSVSEGTAPTRFRDRRENLVVYAVDVDMAAFRTWVNAAWGARRSRILYVEFRNVPSGVLPAVRIINGEKLPGPEPTPEPAADYGLTIATHVPLYVRGAYNWDGSVPNWKPSALMADALTILSAAWNDDGDRSAGCRYGTQAQVGGPPGQRCTNWASSAAGTTTINAAIAVGHSATPCDVTRAGCSSAAYGGGVENLPRLLEDWGSRTLAVNGSFVSLFPSQVAQASAATLTNGPTRVWRFDGRFTEPANYPPGTPLVGTVTQLAFRPLY